MRRSRDPLVALFYYLLRDYVQPGDFAHAMSEVAKLKGKSARYSTPELAALAGRYATTIDRLRHQAVRMRTPTSSSDAMRTLSRLQRDFARTGAPAPLTPSEARLLATMLPATPPGSDAHVNAVAKLRKIGGL